MTERLAEVRRLLDRYIVEVVEAYEFCPWAKAARLGDEIAVDVLWGAPAPAAWIDAGRKLLALPRTRVAMVIAPELAATPAELSRVRDYVAAKIPGAGIAEFHPDAALDLATPARLVPFLRRSPDPLLQMVPLELLDRVRTHTTVVDVHDQAQMLGGFAEPQRRDVADSIAETNHARAGKDASTIGSVLDDIAADRRRSYERVGIAISTGR